MSTAIALQNIPQSHSQEQNVMRRRSAIKTDSKITTPPQLEEDPWLSTPQDTHSSDLSLESPSFAPTNTYWITPHGMLSKSIQILDLTRDLSVPYTGLTPAYKEAVKKTLKDHSFTPTLTAHRKTWLGLQYSITDGEGKEIAEWKHPYFSTGSAVLTFPEGSKHCEHSVELRNKKWGLRTEAFVVNSVQFEWEADSYWHSTNMTLYKVLSMGDGDGKGKAERKIVGKYAQKCMGSFVTGGILVVDAESINGAVAGLTLCVVLKKKRQRGAERNPGCGVGGN